MNSIVVGYLVSTRLQLQWLAQAGDALRQKQPGSKLDGSSLDQIFMLAEGCLMKHCPCVIEVKP